MTETGFTAAQKAAIMLRDGEVCILCGRHADVVNHRKNRGAGGRLSLNIISNGCALCWACNDLIERDAVARFDAIHLGAKLEDHMSFQTLLWSPFYGMWLQLFDDYCELTGLVDRGMGAIEATRLYNLTT